MKSDPVLVISLSVPPVLVLVLYLQAYLHGTCRLTRVHVPHNLAHDIFMLQKFGMADKETLLRSVTPTIRTWIETEMRRDRGGVSNTWYNVPMTVLTQLVLKVNSTLMLLLICVLPFNPITVYFMPQDEFIRLIAEKSKGIDREKLTAEECLVEEDKAFRVLYLNSCVWSSMYKYVSHLFLHLRLGIF